VRKEGRNDDGEGEATLPWDVKVLGKERSVSSLLPLGTLGWWCALLLLLLWRELELGERYEDFNGNALK
jgi:hypothetical protein